MKASLTWIAKAAALWAALIAANMIAGLLIELPETAAGGDGPLALGEAFLLVNAAVALVLAALAARMPGTPWRRAAILFALLFATETLLSVVESIFFAGYIGLPEGMLAALTGLNAIKSALAAAAAGFLWRPGGAVPPLPSGLAWKIPAIAAAYVLCYFGAGHLIAWQSAAVRAYYGDGLAIDQPALILLQAGRGLAWAGLAWLAASSLRGATAARAAVTGLAFAVFMAGPLLYPNGLMPWSVRSVHLVEIATSNFLFGVAAILILASGRGVGRKNRSDAAAAAA